MWFEIMITFGMLKCVYVIEYAKQHLSYFSFLGAPFMFLSMF